jgi:hypothetical protein
MLLLGITGHHIPCFRLLVVVSCTIAFHPRERHEINSRGDNGGDEERRQSPGRSSFGEMQHLAASRLHGIK